MVAEELVGVASTTPIIFDIFLHKEQFIPHIVALEKTKPFSQKCLPRRIDEKNLLPFLQDMKSKAANLMNDYFDSDENYDKDNWSYYLFKDKLQEFRNTVESDTGFMVKID